MYVSFICRISEKYFVTCRIEIGDHVLRYFLHANHFIFFGSYIFQPAECTKKNSGLSLLITNAAKIVSHDSELVGEDGSLPSVQAIRAAVQVFHEGAFQSGG